MIESGNIYTILLSLFLLRALISWARQKILVQIIIISPDDSWSDDSFLFLIHKLISFFFFLWSAKNLNERTDDLYS